MDPLTILIWFALILFVWHIRKLYKITSPEAKRAKRLTAIRDWLEECNEPPARVKDIIILAQGKGSITYRPELNGSLRESIKAIYEIDGIEYVLGLTYKDGELEKVRENGKEINTNLPPNQ